MKHTADIQIIDTDYVRVLPRDLFNEAKLLKCVGQLCLNIHDNNTPVAMSFDEDVEKFEIGLLDDGYLAIANLSVFIKGKPFLFKSQYNSKSPYPLFVEFDYCEYQVFDDKGEWSVEFINFVTSK